MARQICLIGRRTVALQRQNWERQNRMQTDSALGAPDVTSARAVDLSPRQRGDPFDRQARGSGNLAASFERNP